MDGFHTLIELATPATVRYEAGNMLLFEGLKYKVVGDAPQEDVEIYVESQHLPDDMVYGGVSAMKLVESQAKLLLVQTFSFRSIGGKDHLQVFRLEKYSFENGVPSFLQVLPRNTDILGYFSQLKQTHKQSVTSHASLVQRVMGDFSANNPRMLYDGPFMLDALLTGEKEVTDRIH